MDKNSRIYVAGHSGLAGSAIVRELKRRGYENIIAGYDKDGLRVDLRNAAHTDAFFNQFKPKQVVMAAAHAGGIKQAIDKPAEMLYDNILMTTNVIEACRKFGVKKLINLGSSCIYPVNATQPYKEEFIGQGRTDENWSYAVAKLAGVEMCRAYHRQYGSNFMTVMPCNLYGYNDNFDLEKAHVIPALIRKFTENDKVEVWGGKGDGYYTPMREFLFTDDFAEAVVMLMENHNYEDLYDGVVNIGYGADVEIATVVSYLQRIIGERKIVYNRDKPLGVRSKLLDITRIKALGWRPKTTLYEGMEKVNAEYRARCESGENGQGAGSVLCPTDCIREHEKGEEVFQEQANKTICGVLS